VNNKRVVFNLILIAAFLLLAVMTYPSELAEFLLLAAGVGIFITVGKVVPFSFRNKKTVWLLAGMIAAAFSITLIFVLI
jgi:hypothetical protein